MSSGFGTGGAGAAAPAAAGGAGAGAGAGAGGNNQEGSSLGSSGATPLLRACWCGSSWHGDRTRLCPGVPIAGHWLQHYQAMQLLSWLPFKGRAGCSPSSLTAMGLTSGKQKEFDARLFRKHKLIRRMCGIAEELPLKRWTAAQLADFERWDGLSRSHLLHAFQVGRVNLGTSSLSASRTRPNIKTKPGQEELPWMCAMDPEQHCLRQLVYLFQAEAFVHPALLGIDVRQAAASVPKAMRLFNACDAPSTLLPHTFKFLEDAPVQSSVVKLLVEVYRGHEDFNAKEAGLAYCLKFEITHGRADLLQLRWAMQLDGILVPAAARMNNGSKAFICDVLNFNRVMDRQMNDQQVLRLDPVPLAAAAAVVEEASASSSAAAAASPSSGSSSSSSLAVLVAPAAASFSLPEAEGSSLESIEPGSAQPDEDTPLPLSPLLSLSDSDAEFEEEQQTEQDSHKELAAVQATEPMTPSTPSGPSTPATAPLSPASTNNDSVFAQVPSPVVSPRLSGYKRRAGDSFGDDEDDEDSSFQQFSPQSPFESEHQDLLSPDEPSASKHPKLDHAPVFDVSPFSPDLFHIPSPSSSLFPLSFLPSNLFDALPYSSVPHASCVSAESVALPSGRVSPFSDMQDA